MENKAEIGIFGGTGLYDSGLLMKATEDIAEGSLRIGLKSLNKIPFFGKFGNSSILSLRFIVMESIMRDKNCFQGKNYSSTTVVSASSKGSTALTVYVPGAISFVTNHIVENTPVPVEKIVSSVISSPSSAKIVIIIC